MQSIGNLQLNIVLNLENFNSLSAVLNVLKLFSKQSGELLKFKPDINISTPIADLSKLSKVVKATSAALDSSFKSHNSTAEKGL